MVSLSELLEALPHAIVSPSTGEVVVRQVVYDSRRVEPGALFVAISGQHTDGHDYVPQAVARGAVAVVVERAVEGVEVPVIQVPSSREALALLSDRFYGYPSRRLIMVGVTGTNGKSSTTHLIAHILRSQGIRTGTIGTLGAFLDGVGEVPISHTTPEAPEIQSLLAKAVENGISAIVMEVSSHALHQHRTLGIEFDVAVFTNLTQDHLDYHGSMEEYAASKRRLFVDYPARSRKPFQGIYNLDDPIGRQWYAQSKYTRWGYGVSSEDAQFKAVQVQLHPHAVEMQLQTPEGRYSVNVPLGGAFQTYNILAAVAASSALNVSVHKSVQALQHVPQVPGRFELVPNDRGIIVVVDYAHTPDSLEKLLDSARAMNPRRLIVVFGCGGNRDRAKRPIMGRIGSQMADVCVITSDNPRHEPPEAIIEEILQGVSMSDKVVVEPDRQRAIKHAIEIAHEGDMVVIAGKGHETVQIIGDQRIPFDDREIARQFLKG